MKRLFVFILFVALLLMSLSVVTAQVPPGVDVVGEVPTPSEFFVRLQEFVATFGVAGGLLVSLGTAFLKRQDFLKDVDAGLVKFVLTIVVSIIFYIANAFGVQQQFQDGAQIIVAFLAALGVGSTGAQLWYTHALKGVPYLGTSRTTPEN